MLALVDRLGCLGRNGKRLEVHVVVFDVVGLHGAEGAGPYMERDGDALYALRVERGEYLGREVKPRRRRGDRTDLARVDRLVALAVFLLLLGRSLALHVGRNRRTAKLVEKVH